MHRAILGIGRVPGDRLEALGSYDGPREIGSIGKIVAKTLIAVHHPNHIVVGSLLRYHRNLALHLLIAGISIPRSRREIISLLRHHLSAETSGGALYHRHIILIVRCVAVHDEPARPFLPDEILGESIGAHRVAWNDVEHIRAALLLPEAIVARADVDEDRVLSLRQIGNSDMVFGFEIGDDEGIALGKNLLGLGDNVAVGRNDGLNELEGIGDEPPWLVGLLDDPARALNAFVEDRLLS